MTHPCKTLSLLGCILFLLIHEKLYAQNFIILHDLQKDTTHFLKVEKLNDTINIPGIAIKRPGRISVKVENFNPFYWNAKVTVYRRPIDEEAGQIGMFMSGLTSGLGFSVLPAPVSASRGAVDLQTQKRLTALYNNLVNLGDQLAELKYDSKKTELEIKTETQNIGNKIMGLLSIDSLNVASTKQRGRDLDDSISGASTKLSFSGLFPAITKTYNEIMGTNFKYTYSIKGSIDINELKLQVFPRNESIAGESSNDTITKYFQLRGRSGLRLRNSAGITFTYFSDKNTSYYVKPDLTIGKGNGDLFTPVLSSIIHFYGNKNSGLKIGGAFGVGIPLVGERKDLNFMLGPSAVLGRSELIFISAGICGTSVPELGNGFHVGETVGSADYTLPIVYRFRPGAFISITFNLKNISQEKSPEE